MTWIKNPPSPGIEVTNWAECSSAAELLTWVPEDFRLIDPITGRPVHGKYKLTGYEKTGGCWWCGKELPGKQIKWCTRTELNEKHGHWIEYYRHFCWPYARDWCIKRYDRRCANCGRTADEVYQDMKDQSPQSYRGDFSTAYSLQAHHIIPLEGSERQWTPYNLPWNLICLCHFCHLEVHAAMRPVRRPPDTWKAKVAAGQLILFPELANINAEGYNVISGRG